MWEHKVDAILQHLFRLFRGHPIVNGRQVKSLATCAFSSDLPPTFPNGSFCCEDNAVSSKFPVMGLVWHQEVGLSVHDALFLKRIATLPEQSSNRGLKSLAGSRLSRLTDRKVKTVENLKHRLVASSRKEFTQDFLAKSVLTTEVNLVTQLFCALHQRAELAAKFWRRQLLLSGKTSCSLVGYFVRAADFLFEFLK